MNDLNISNALLKSFPVLGNVCSVLAMTFVCSVSAVSASAGPDDVNKVAKELSNPAGSLAALNINFQFNTYKGDLPNADSQNSTSILFQPIMPFPVGDKGRNILFRPAFPVFFDQPIFDAGKGDFEEANSSLGDTTFDLVYAGTEMTDPKNKKGYLWGAGAAGTLRTATSNDVAGKQWRLGPELFGGIVRKWGVAGALVSHQWDIAGAESVSSFSSTTAQYFFAIALDKPGLQVFANPVASYNWKADSDDALTLPVGIGLSQTTKLGERHWKFQGQVQYYVEQPDQFGPEWLIKFTVTPVVQNKLAGLFK